MPSRDSLKPIPYGGTRDQSTVATPGGTTSDPATTDDYDDDDDGHYSLDAELTFSSEELFLSPTLSDSTGLTFEVDSRASTATATKSVYVSVDGPDVDQALDAMVSDETVSDQRCIAEFDDQLVVRVRPSQSAIRLLPKIGAVGGYIRSFRGHATGWTVRTYLAGRSNLSDLNDRCHRDDVSVSVGHLATLDTQAAPDETTLTGEQRELLITANLNGYFEVPRGISQRDLADQFGVSPSAISQQLRTAVGALITSTYGPR